MSIHRKRKRRAQTVRRTTTTARIRVDVTPMTLTTQWQNLRAVAYCSDYGFVYREVQP